MYEERFLNLAPVFSYLQANAETDALEKENAF